MWVPGQAKGCSHSSQFIWTCLAFREVSELHLLLGRLGPSRMVILVPDVGVCEEFREG